MIDIGGGDSRLVDRLVQEGVRCVFVLDVSGEALSRARARLGPDASCVTWIDADVTADWRTPLVDIWHDRAVFHFLTEPADRRAYLTHLRLAVKPAGAVVLAAFGLAGPERCSGLPVVRYSPETLAAELGPDFTLVESLAHLHRTPSGTVQSFLHARFVRASTLDPRPPVFITSSRECGE